jgi:predicted GNAT family N-acyltransferase
MLGNLVSLTLHFLIGSESIVNHCKNWQVSMQPLTIKVSNYAECLNAIQAIRYEVFQREQGVDPELDLDGFDASAIHVLATWSQEPVGTARIRYVNDDVAKIERLAVLPNFRQRGIARQMMDTALAFLKAHQTSKVILNAQEYIVPFYSQLGFEPVGDRFLEANIPHIKMQKWLEMSD